MPRTRLAPSPTGALHLGNVRTFLVNWALARQRGWQVVLRIDDLDGPRIKAGAAAEAIDLLCWLGLDWDEGPYYQRNDLAPYHAALDRLAAQGDVYPCRCTRREIEAAALSAPHGDEHELRYPGTCKPPSLEGRGRGRDLKFLGGSTYRTPASSESSSIPPLSASHGLPHSARSPSGDRARLVPPFEGGGSQTAWRLIVPDGVTEFVDQFVGRHEHDVQAASGDFLVATKEGLPSYQLAVVVDDARQRIDRIVRGDDLLASTHRQLLLQQRLRIAQRPEYFHLPLVVGPDGRRLAKRHGDSRVSHYRELGVTPQRLIGLMAEWCGLGPRDEITAATFAERFDLATMSRAPIVFMPTDDAWLQQP